MKIVEAWYKDSAWLIPLRPIAWVTALVSKIRRANKPLHRSPVPIVVVGNITVGGTGKTPLVIYLAEQLKALGYRPGIVSRGYGGNAPSYPYRVMGHCKPRHSGDEPLVISRRTGCPVVVDPNRVRAVDSLLATSDCNVVLSDDGLQHYAMARDVEIVVIDGDRRLGNERCIPAGPLREPKSRLNGVKFLILNGGEPKANEILMQLKPVHWVNIKKPSQTLPVEAFLTKQVHAVAAIGHPGRFFKTVEMLGARVTPHAFADHHAFMPEELVFGDDLPIVMTEKDAVKCESWAPENAWYLKVEAELPATFIDNLLPLLRK